MLTDFKFKIGEKVEVYGSIMEKKGKVVERCIKNSEIREYTVEFSENNLERFNEEDLRMYIPPCTACQCGAKKVYGKSCTKAHHALWCIVRKED